VDVLIDGERIAAVVPAGTGRGADDSFDCRGALVTPGLIDAHTHPVYAAPRLEEVARRAAGASYSEIASLGGGINATVASTRDTPIEVLQEGARSRFSRWLEQGTTTLEAKSGYWLNHTGEIEAVRLMAALSADPSLPRLCVTFLGAHELPAEFRDDRDSFVREVESWSEEAAGAGAQFCDVFCDQGAFSVDEARAILLAGRRAGLGLRIHADEIALTGGSHLAAELGVASADHLLRIGDAEITALKRAGCTATLCPVTALNMGQLPPARSLIERGVPIALGTDHNPGTSGTTSMSLVVYLAVCEFKMTVDEAVTAATWGGARSLQLHDRGLIEDGMLADLTMWDADHEGAFAWEPGLRAMAVWRGGQLVKGSS
jgi:imidazolonepropionase